MDIVVIVAEILILVCVVLLIFILMYNNYQSYIIRINEVETNIDSILRKRFDLVCKCIEIIQNITKKEDFSEILELREQKTSNFDLDRKLTGAIIKFDTYKYNYEELESNDVFIKSCVTLEECAIELEAFKKYYNDIVTEYNKKVKQFPSDVVAKISHFKVKPYFDGKDMFDDVTDDFKL